MDAPSFENLDLACARMGKTIAERPSKELENLITNALAVLEEQGLYALFLYLDRGISKEKQKLAKDISPRLHDFLKKTPQQAPLLADSTGILASLQEMADDLDRLLLARDLVRQSLVYARYHARVPEKNEVQT
jgi:hypothetical protein